MIPFFLHLDGESSRKAASWVRFWTNGATTPQEFIHSKLPHLVVVLVIAFISHSLTFDPHFTDGPRG